MYLVDWFKRRLDVGEEIISVLEEIFEEIIYNEI